MIAREQPGIVQFRITCTPPTRGRLNLSTQVSFLSPISIEINATPMPCQEWHPKDNILLKLTDDECLLDSLVSDTSGQFYDAIEENVRLVCQGAILSVIWLKFTPDLSTECAEELAAYEVRGPA